MKRVMILGAALVAALAVAAPASASTDQGGAVCQLDGTATFGTPLTNTAGPFSYTFSGSLTGCQTDVPGGPTQGTVAAGERITVGGVEYDTPAASGHGSCASSTTDGVSFIVWQDNTLTIVGYHTEGVTAAIGLTGKVLPSAEVTRVSDGATVTLATNRFPAGADSLGALVFEADATQCAGAGVSSAKIHGVTGVGNYA